MSTLVAYIAIFIGAGIFGIAGGIPLNPLQILWLNMVIDIPIAIALGFDEPTPRTDGAAHRARSARPCSRTPNWVRLCVQGFVMTVGALVAYQIGEANYGGRSSPPRCCSRRCRCSTWSRGCWRAIRSDTIFDRDAIPGPAQLRRYGLSLLAIVAHHGDRVPAADLRHHVAQLRAVVDLHRARRRASWSSRS